MELSFDTNEGSLLTVESHRTVPAPFLTKTFHLVDDAGTDDIVSWSEDGTTFIVWRPPEFAKDILPNYFKHNNFSSFVRQLNTYGFRKIVSDRWEFANEYFRKGHQDLLSEIHRRKTGQPNPGHPLRPASAEDFFWSHHISASPPVVSARPPGGGGAPQSSHFTAAVSICDENERLRRDNCILLSELARLRRLNDEVLFFLQNQVRMPQQELGSGIKWLKYNSLPPLLPPSSTPRFEEIVDDHIPPKPLITTIGSRQSLLDTALVITRASPMVVPHTREPVSLDFHHDRKELKHSSSATTTTGAAATTDSSEENESSPKLFGVSLNTGVKKRSRSPGNESPRAKSPKNEVTLQLGTDPCWLKACKSVSEKIFI